MGMLGINVELDSTKKLEIGIVVVVLCVIGYFVHQNWGYWSGNQKNTTMTVWMVNRPVGVDPKLQISKKNPVDPNTKVVATVFASYDGQLDIIDTTVGGNTKTTVRFKPDSKRDKFNVWQNQWDKLETIKDPARRLVAFAGYTIAEKKRSPLTRAVDFTQEQRQTEFDARTQLKERILLLEDGAADGTYEPKVFAKLLKALEAYRALPGDPAKDSTKGAAAAKVMELGLDYVQKVQAGKTSEIEKYVDTVYKLLDADQKQKMAEALKTLAAQGRLFPKAG